jgi:predicted amidohydrolase
MTKVACLQTCAGPDTARNLAEIERLATQARKAGAELISLPEAADFRDKGVDSFRAYAPPFEDHPTLRGLQKMTRKLGCWVLVGSITTRNDRGTISNRSLVLDAQGKIVAQYDKIHLFDTGVIGAKASTESAIYERGKQAVIQPSPIGVLGLSICYDLRFPYLYRILARFGANVLTVPSNFRHDTGEAHWHVLLRARAIETGAYVIAPAQCGGVEANEPSYGHTLIVDPWGEVLADAGTEVGVVLADIDLTRVETARERIRSLSHDQSFAPPLQSALLRAHAHVY